jgi:hypothetical protein
MNTPEKPSSLPDGQDLPGTAVSEINVKVNFLIHIDPRVAPRKLQVSCPFGATVQDLIDILSGTYGESLRNVLHQRNLMAIVNGISKGRNFRNALLGADGEKEIEIIFMIFMDHGG